MDLECLSIIINLIWASCRLKRGVPVASQQLWPQVAGCKLLRDDIEYGDILEDG